MKNTIKNLLTVVAALCIAGAFGHQAMEEPHVPLSTPTSQSEPKTWQEQVKYALDKSTNQTRGDGSLSLIGYSYRGTIESESEIPGILEDLFSDDVPMVVGGHTSNFEIVPISTVKKMYGEDIFEAYKTHIAAAVQVGMELISLEWSHNGKNYLSLAIADNNDGGIIYENIGHLILEDRNKNETDTFTSGIIPSVKTRSESSDDGTEIRRNFSLHDEYRNWLGTRLWFYKIGAYAVFDAKSGVLKRCNSQAFSDSKYGWSCQAQINKTSGEIGKTAFVEYSWAYAYGSGLNIGLSIAWNGMGFVINSTTPVTSAMGQEALTP
jgi:hypothetical protein